MTIPSGLSAFVSSPSSATIPKTPHKGGKHFRTPSGPRRQIVPLSTNTTPSIGESRSDRESIMGHATDRISLFSVFAHATHGIGYSENRDPNKIRVMIGRAYLQMGQGHNGYHAAHAHAFAGLQDNIRDIFLDEIITNKEVTPNKRRALGYKGFTHDHVADIEKNIDYPKIVEEIFKKIWPESCSFIQHTLLDDLLNTTHTVPRTVNLCCDGTLEKTLRPSLPEFIPQLYAAKITPEESCKQYVAWIQACFDEQIAIMETKIASETDKSKKANYEKLLNFFKWEREGSEDGDVARKLFQKYDPVTKTSSDFSPNTMNKTRSRLLTPKDPK